MPINYSTNYMGPVNSDWIKKHGSDWAGGRIDLYGVNSDYPEEFEISLPFMKTDDYKKFSDWLETLETDDVWTLQQLVEQYQKTNSKIVWHRTPSWMSVRRRDSGEELT